MSEFQPTNRRSRWRRDIDVPAPGKLVCVCIHRAPDCPCASIATLAIPRVRFIQYGPMDLMLTALGRCAALRQRLCGLTLYYPYMADMNDVLREFDSVEANLERLENLWDRLAYEEDARAFRRILQVMPTIDGRRLEDSIMDLDEIAQARFDAEEVGEIECRVSVEQAVTQQGAHLRAYRARFQHQRRVFIREHLIAAVCEVDRLLAEIGANPQEDSGRRVEHMGWETLKKTVAQIGVLLGSAADRGSRWSDLHRHLAFGLWQDFNDIVKWDWPNVKKTIEAGMYGKDEPLPVVVTDLNKLAASHTSGAVATRLKWASLSEHDFERLLYTLMCRTKGYENTDWLMKANAPDRGRDVATWRVSNDSLIGNRRHRVIVQCKHWLSKSIGVDEIAKLKEQMELWEPPPNAKRAVPMIFMWPESHLEQLLAPRPDIVAEFRLR